MIEEDLTTKELVKNAEEACKIASAKAGNNAGFASGFYAGIKFATKEIEKALQ